MFFRSPAALHPARASRLSLMFFLSKVHILGVGLAVHEKLVHPEMRPLHKKLIDQFQMMRSSLCHVSSEEHDLQILLHDSVSTKKHS